MASSFARWKVPVEYLAVALFPAITLLTLPSVFNQVGWLDPYFYTGLIANYDDIVDRYGSTYYAARIAHIFPAIAFDRLFGHALGFFAFHYTLLLICCISVYRFGRRLYSSEIGLCVAAAVSFTPWALFQFSYDHYEGTAFTYLLVATLLALAPVKNVRWLQFAAGFVLGIGANVNPFVLLVFGFLAPTLLLAHRSRGASNLGIMAGLGLMGAAAGVLAINIAQRLIHETWQASDPTFSMIVTLISGGQQIYFQPFSEVIVKEAYAFFIASAIGLLLAALYVARMLRQDDPDASSPDRYITDTRSAVLLAPFTVTALYLIYQFGLKGGILTLNYYLNYLLVPGLLVLTTALGETVGRLAQPLRLSLAAAFIIVAALIQVLLTPGGVQMLDQLDWFSLGIGTAILVAAVFTLEWLRVRIALAATTLAATLFLLLVPYQDRDFEAMRTPNPSGWDVRDGAIHLVDLVASKLPKSRGAVGIWYPHSDLALNSVHSAHMFTYSMLGEREGPGLPVIDQDAMDELSRFSSVVLMASSSALVDEGITALNAVPEEGEEFKLTDRGRFQGKQWGYDYAILENTPPKAPPVEASPESIGWLDMGTLAATPDWTPAKVSSAGDRKRIDSHNGIGSFSAMIAIPEALRRPGAGKVRIWVEMAKGGLGVQAVPSSDIGKILGKPAAIKMLGQELLVEVQLEDLAIPTSLLFINLSASGQSVGFVRAIEIVSLAGQQPVLSATPDPATPRDPPTH